MGKEIVYCADCGKRLQHDDFDRGKAILVENRPFCGDCRSVERSPKRPTPSSLPSVTPPPQRISTARLPVLVPSTTRRRGSLRAASRRSVHLGIGAAAAAGMILAAFALRSSNDGATGAATPAAPSAPPAGRPAPPSARPGGEDRAGTARRAVEELEALAAGGADEARALARCEEIREQVRGTAYEPRLRDLEIRLLEQRREKERDQQVARALADARSILTHPRAVERKADVLSLLRAVRPVAGARRAEVDRLIDEAERLREETPPSPSSAVSRPPEAKSPPPAAPPSPPASPPPAVREAPASPDLWEFQDGVSPTAAYAGTRDAGIVEDAPDKRRGTSSKIEIDGDEPGGSGKDAYLLVRWDLSAIPRGLVPQAATLTFTLLDGGKGKPYPIYAVRRPWEESEVTWNHAASGRPWEVPGARGASDRNPTEVGRVSSGKRGPVEVVLNAAGIEVLRSWIEDPSSNFGFIIADPEASDGIDVVSREGRNPQERPKLTLRLTRSDVPGRPLEPTGLVTQWLVLGPFGNRADPQGLYDHDLLKGEVEHVPTVGGEVVSREGTRLRWTPVEAPSGDVLFHELPGFEEIRARKAPAIAYAACWIHADGERAVKFRVNADQGYRLYFQHKVTGNRPGGFGLDRDPETYSVRLRPGPNLLLVKVATAGGPFALRIRITTTADLRKAAPGVLVSALPPRETMPRVAFRENFDQGTGRFVRGRWVEGGRNGSKALEVSREGVVLERPFSGPVTDRARVRFWLKPFCATEAIEMTFWSARRGLNHWHHIRGLRPGEWNLVEVPAAEARGHYMRTGPALDGEVPDNLILYFDDATEGARILLDDFEILE